MSDGDWYSQNFCNCVVSHGSFDTSLTVLICAYTDLVSNTCDSRFLHYHVCCSTFYREKSLYYSVLYYVILCLVC